MIGIFDSGVGGLTVVKEIFKQLPGYQITYFGDTARLPYGTKGADFVKKYSSKITNWLLNKNAKIIVLTNVNSDEKLAEFLEKGAYDYLLKSDWAIADVVKKVKDKLNGKR